MRSALRMLLQGEVGEQALRWPSDRLRTAIHNQPEGTQDLQSDRAGERPRSRTSLARNSARRSKNTGPSHGAPSGSPP